MVTVVNSRIMTCNDICQQLTETIHGHLCLLSDEDFTGKFLQKSHFTAITLQYKDETFTLYHGFPGENPVGILVDSNRILVAHVGELGDSKMFVETEAARALFEWYNTMTNDLCEYKYPFMLGLVSE